MSPIASYPLSDARLLGSWCKSGFVFSSPQKHKIKQIFYEEMINLAGLESSIRILYIVACVYVTKEEKRSIKMFGRSKVQGSNEVEGPVADPPSGGYPDRVVRVVIGEQDEEMPKTSLDQDYPKGDIEKVFLQYAKG